MKLFTLTLLSCIALLSYGQEDLSKCKNQCRVNRIIEEGVFLGVRIQSNQHPNIGASVMEIIPNTSASKSDIKLTDIITHIDKVEVLGSKHVVDIIQSHKAGDKVEVLIQRGDQTIVQRIRLGAKSTRIEEVLECCDELKAPEEASVLIEGINLYPNPARDFITIKTKEAIEGEAVLTIYGIDGKPMMYEQFNNNEALNQKVDLAKYSSGNYYVRLETTKKNYLEKFEVVK